MTPVTNIQQKRNATTGETLYVEGIGEIYVYGLNGRLLKKMRKAAIPTPKNLKALAKATKQKHLRLIKAAQKSHLSQQSHQAQPQLPVETNTADEPQVEYIEGIGEVYTGIPVDGFWDTVKKAATTIFKPSTPQTGIDMQNNTAQKPETAQEQSFFQKYKVPIITCGVLLAGGTIAVIALSGKKEKKTSENK
jgi:hypothetical protein